jgi:hypothetical protein
VTDNGLTVVEYWIELKPYLVFISLAVTPVSLSVVILGFILARIPLTDLWVFVLAAAIVIALNAYISKRQAQWLVAFTRRELEASNSAPVAL